MLKSYYQLTKPGIIYGNLLTTAAGFLLASRQHIVLGRLLAVLAGTSLIIGAACIVNNYIDRGIDAKMARTKKRALVTGAISVRNAMILAATLGVLGFAALILWTNLLTAGLGVAALVFYVVLYGVAKRKTVHGTLVGSVAGAAPPVAGYVAASGHLDGGALLLFLVLVCWQMPHFYAIAIYRAKEYKAAKIPVLPLVHGVQAAKIQITLYVIAFLLVSAQLTVFGYTHYSYLGVMTIVGAVWLWRALQGFTATDVNRWARQVFLTSLIVILILSIMLAIGDRLA